MVFSIFIAIIVGVVFARLVFSISTITDNLIKQTKLLALISEKLGVAPDDVKAAMKEPMFWDKKKK